MATIKDTVKLTISRRQFDHIIAGLRAAQARWYTPDSFDQTQSEMIREIATGNGDLMTADEIDEFIQEIN